MKGVFHKKFFNLTIFILLFINFSDATGVIDANESSEESLYRQNQAPISSVKFTENLGKLIYSGN